MIQGALGLALVLALALPLTALLACSPSKAKPRARAELRQVGPKMVEVIPTEGQLPYCLVFTTSEAGVTRQLTMTFEDQSVPCEAGTPIGGVPYRIPASEGKVRVHVLFSDRPLKAGSLAQEISELATSNPQFTAMDLRAPGQLLTETLEFTPSAR